MPTKIAKSSEGSKSKELVEVNKQGPSQYYVPSNFRATLPPQFTNFSSAINSYNSEHNTAPVSRYASQSLANQP